MLRPGHGDQCCEKVLDVATELINHSCGYLQVRLVQFQNRSAGVVCVCGGGGSGSQGPTPTEELLAAGGDPGKGSRVFSFRGVVTSIWSTPKWVLKGKEGSREWFLLWGGV